MTETPDIDTVETADDYIHVRFRDPDRFDEIRTPDWAANAARSVSDGAEVRTGRVEASDDWQVEAVLIGKTRRRGQGNGASEGDRGDDRIVNDHRVVDRDDERCRPASVTKPPRHRWNGDRDR